MAELLGVANPTKTGTDFEGATTVIASKFTASATGTVDTISLRLNSTNTFAGTINCGIYTDNAGTPQTRLGTAQTIAASAGAGTKTSTGGVGASVTSGTVYWIAFEATAQFDFECSSGNGGSGGTTAGTKDTSNGQSGIPASWPATVGTFAETISAWASDAGGAVVTVPVFVPHRMPLGV